MFQCRPNIHLHLLRMARIRVKWDQFEDPYVGLMKRWKMILSRRIQLSLTYQQVYIYLQSTYIFLKLYISEFSFSNKQSAETVLIDLPFLTVICTVDYLFLCFNNELLLLSTAQLARDNCIPPVFQDLNWECRIILFQSLYMQ